MKKRSIFLLAIVLIVVLAFGLSACKKTEEVSKEEYSSYHISEGSMYALARDLNGKWHVQDAQGKNMFDKGYDEMAMLGEEYQNPLLLVRNAGEKKYSILDVKGNALTNGVDGEPITVDLGSQVMPLASQMSSTITKSEKGKVEFKVENRIVCWAVMVDLDKPDQTRTLLLNADGGVSTTLEGLVQDKYILQNYTTTEEQGNKGETIVNASNVFGGMALTMVVADEELGSKSVTHMFDASLNRSSETNVQLLTSSGTENKYQYLLYTCDGMATNSVMLRTMAGASALKDVDTSQEITMQENGFIYTTPAGEQPAVQKHVYLGQAGKAVTYDYEYGADKLDGQTVLCDEYGKAVVIDVKQVFSDALFHYAVQTPKSLFFYNSSIRDDNFIGVYNFSDENATVHEVAGKDGLLYVVDGNKRIYFYRGVQKGTYANDKITYESGASIVCDGIGYDVVLQTEKQTTDGTEYQFRTINAQNATVTAKYSTQQVESADGMQTQNTILGLWAEMNGNMYVLPIADSNMNLVAATTSDYKGEELLLQFENADGESYFQYVYIPMQDGKQQQPQTAWFGRADSMKLEFEGTTQETQLRGFVLQGMEMDGKKYSSLIFRFAIDNQMKEKTSKRLYAVSTIQETVDWVGRDYYTTKTSGFTKVWTMDNQLVLSMDGSLEIREGVRGTIALVSRNSVTAIVSLDGSSYKMLTDFSTAKKEILGMDYYLVKDPATDSMTLFNHKGKEILSGITLMDEAGTIYDYERGEIMMLFFANTGGMGEKIVRLRYTLEEFMKVAD